MSEQRDGRAPWVPWAVTSVALLVVAAMAYYFGVRNGELAAAGGDGLRAWRGHGHGFSGLWMFFVMFWVFASLRWVWWGPRHYGWRHRGPWRGYDDDRTAWEEWHRQAHRAADAPRDGAPAGDPRSR